MTSTPQFDLTTKAGIGKAMTYLAAECSSDPLRFVQVAFPWGKDSLEGMTGPDKWQTAILTDMRDKLKSGAAWEHVMQYAVAAGHGVGKSGLVAWIILWGLCTFPDTRIVVTANTENQLRTKTFAEVAKWHNLCLFREWFSVSAMSVACKQPGHDKTWRADAIPWSETKPEGFAGLHNKRKRIIVIFDEASAIADSIWEVTEGALTDSQTQIFWLAFGNPTRSTGRFYECFNKFRHRWDHRHVDGRDAAMTDKTKIAEWLADYGEDSDFFKVRVRGVFPSSSDMQFIPRDIVEAAASRPLAYESVPNVVAIIGVDVARFGSDASVIRVRYGQDARSFKKIKLHGLDGFQLGARVAEVYNELVHSGSRRVLINVDVGGVGASPVDWLRNNGYSVNAIQFGSNAADTRKYKNLRAEMWGRMRDWLKAVGCIERDDDLVTDLTGVEYGYTPTGQLLLEKKEDMKKRGLASPDDADALALTFAVRVNEYLDDPTPPAPRKHRSATSRDPYR